MSIPLILLPGTGCNELLWSKLLPLLAAELHPIAIDLLGLSSIDAMVEKIAKQPYTTFALLGFSMGGVIAQEFCARYPERLSHLILMCCTGDGYNAHYAAKRIDHANYLASHPDMILSPDYLNGFLHQDSPHFQDARDMSQHMMKMAGVAKICVQMQATAKRNNNYPALEQLTIPRLVIGATHDRIAVMMQIEKLAKALHVEPHFVNSGHMAPLENPEPVAAIVNEWFAILT